MIKTDGIYIYTITNSVLSIVRAYPENKFEILASIPFRTPISLFVEGNYLAVFGKNDIYGKAQTYMSIYDIANRSYPKKIRMFNFTGMYFDGRKA